MLLKVWQDKLHTRRAEKYNPTLVWKDLGSLKQIGSLKIHLRNIIYMYLHPDRQVILGVVQYQNHL